MAKFREVPGQAPFADVDAAIQNPVTLVYITFGGPSGATWREAIWALGDYAALELFLLESEEELQHLSALPPRAQWSRPGGEPLGDAVPKGLFVSRNGKLVRALTGRQAEQTDSLRKTKRELDAAVEPRP